MATGTIPFESVKSAEFTAGIKAYRYGKVVFLSFESCTIPNAREANAAFSSLSELYYPIYAVSFLDSIGRTKRIVISTTGEIYATSALSQGETLRGVVTYIAKN